LVAILFDGRYRIDLKRYGQARADLEVARSERAARTT
jgi:hypothetical protein